MYAIPLIPQTLHEMFCNVNKLTKKNSPNFKILLKTKIKRKKNSICQKNLKSKYKKKG